MTLPFQDLTEVICPHTIVKSSSKMLPQPKCTWFSTWPIMNPQLLAWPASRLEWTIILWYEWVSNSIKRNFTFADKYFLAPRDLNGTLVILILGFSFKLNYNFGHRMDLNFLYLLLTNSFFIIGQNYNIHKRFEYVGNLKFKPWMESEKGNLSLKFG